MHSGRTIHEVAYRLLRGSEFTFTTRPTATLNGLLPISLIVVTQLLTLSNIFCRSDPYNVAFNINPAIRLTLMIDEACDIPTHACIPHPSAIQFKTPDVPFL